MMTKEQLEAIERMSAYMATESSYMADGKDLPEDVKKEKESLLELIMRLFEIDDKKRAETHARVLAEELEKDRLLQNKQANRDKDFSDNDVKITHNAEKKTTTYSFNFSDRLVFMPTSAKAIWPRDMDNAAIDIEGYSKRGMIDEPLVKAFNNYNDITQGLLLGETRKERELFPEKVTKLKNASLDFIDAIDEQIKKLKDDKSPVRADLTRMRDMAIQSVGILVNIENTKSTLIPMMQDNRKNKNLPEEEMRTLTLGELLAAARNLSPEERELFAADRDNINFLDEGRRHNFSDDKSIDADAIFDNYEPYFANPDNRVYLRNEQKEKAAAEANAANASNTSNNEANKDDAAKANNGTVTVEVTRDDPVKEEEKDEKEEEIDQNEDAKSTVAQLGEEQETSYYDLNSREGRELARQAEERRRQAEERRSQNGNQEPQEEEQEFELDGMDGEEPESERESISGERDSLNSNTSSELTEEQIRNMVRRGQNAPIHEGGELNGAAEDNSLEESYFDLSSSEGRELARQAEERRSQNEAEQEDFTIETNSQNEAEQEDFTIETNSQNEAEQEDFTIETNSQNEAEQEDFTIETNSQNEAEQEEFLVENADEYEMSAEELDRMYYLLEKQSDWNSDLTPDEQRELDEYTQRSNHRHNQRDNQNDNQRDNQNDNQRDNQNDNQRDNQNDNQRDNQNDNQNDLDGMEAEHKTHLIDIDFYEEDDYKLLTWPGDLDKYTDQLRDAFVAASAPEGLKDALHYLDTLQMKTNEMCHVSGNGTGVNMAQSRALVDSLLKVSKNLDNQLTAYEDSLGDNLSKEQSILLIKMENIKKITSSANSLFNNFDDKIDAIKDFKGKNAHESAQSQRVTLPEYLAYNHKLSKEDREKTNADKHTDADIDLIEKNAKKIKQDRKKAEIRGSREKMQASSRERISVDEIDESRKPARNKVKHKRSKSSEIGNRRSRDTSM